MKFHSVSAWSVTALIAVSSSVIPGAGGKLLRRGNTSSIINNKRTTRVTTPRRQRQLQTDPILELVGDNGSPSSAFPLQECQADCDNDKDCDHGLVCVQRGRDFVPGCSGDPIDGEDYCVRAQPKELHLMGNNGNPSSNYPLQECQGDCDDDSECDTGLKCFHRSGTTSVPGCAGRGYSGSDYCYDPNVAHNELPVEGNNGSPSDAFPLQECQADCDSDYDVRILLLAFVSLNSF